MCLSGVKGVVALTEGDERVSARPTADVSSLEVNMSWAGYSTCNSILLPQTYVVTIDRDGNLPLDAGPVTISLPADDPFHDGTDVTVELGPAVPIEPPEFDPPSAVFPVARGDLRVPAGDTRYGDGAGNDLACGCHRRGVERDRQRALCGRR